ncbi:hypothetical protein [Anabaena azotica]
MTKLGLAIRVVSYRESGRLTIAHPSQTLPTAIAKKFIANFLV